MVPRVKLCAIARDEGPYLADWVGHHLYFGFDAIEVLVNGTSDQSMPILRTISARHPQVTVRNGDKLLARCLEEGRHFQIEAYGRQARRARREGFTHVAFLDLDEYWTPRDFRAPVQDFLPDDDRVNVVSFPWCLDLPDEERRPFARPFGAATRVQLHHHVKSIGRLDDTLRKPHVHTFKTRGGTRLWVDEPFPLVDATVQKHGSTVTAAHWRQHWSEVPAAFVFHAINRSPAEYLATIAKGQRQSGNDVEFKTNRKGYLPTPAPVLVFDPPRSARRAYQRDRRRFLRGLALGPAVKTSETMLLGRANELARRVERDADLRRHLAVALAGTSLGG